MGGYKGTRILATSVVALGLTYFSFGAVVLLGVVRDRCLSKEVGRSLRAVVLAFGILVGFSWEYAFDVAMSDVDKVTGPGSVNDPVWFAISLGMAALLWPSWRHMVLPY